MCRFRSLAAFARLAQPPHRVDNASLQRIDAWTYDGTGNRLSRQAGQGPVLTLSYPPTSHRVSVAGVARSYDANGNTTARGSESLFYGDHNRLVSWSGAFGMSSASYQHNARGERVWKQSMSGAASMSSNKLPPECLAVQGLILQSFLYDEAGRVIVDRNDPCSDGPLTNYEFVWLDDQPLAVIDADPNLPSPQLVGHITSDHLHTPRAISNANGTVTWTWAPVSGNSTSGGSNVFGDRPAQATGAPFNTRPFNLRFPGQYLDAESGLHYNYFRDYEPGTGRYVQSDPIGLDGGISTYTFVSSRPLNDYDPLGLFSTIHACARPENAQACAAAGIGNAPRPIIVPLVPENTKPRAINYPQRIPRNWVCNSRADCDDRIPGNCPEEANDRWAFGSGVGRSLGEARNIAKSDATHRLGCQPKHVSCKCVSPTGERYSGGC